MSSYTLFALLFTISFFFTVQVSSEEITKLPGLADPPTFKQYSGYKVVNESAGRALFYWFTESQRDPSRDPVVLWLTGGPGCSSLMALLSENGPFRPNTDGVTLFDDPFSWNRVANVIWLESPAGVGFSYSNDSKDYQIVGDERTKVDTYVFLQKFFDEFKEFRKNEFWVTGESYGGHYTPEIVQYIWHQNLDKRNPIINIRGMMVGNGWTYMPIDNLGAITTWWQRFLVPKAQTDRIEKACNLSEVGPLMFSDKQYKWTYNADECDNAINDAMAVFNNVDIYDIYADVCYAAADLKMIKALQKGLLLHSKLIPKSDKKAKKQEIPFDPCIDDHLTNYMNLPDVQRAIHARPTSWGECSNEINGHYNYSDVEASVIPIYWDLLNNTNLHILVYSGDVDGIVPTVGTRIWTAGLGRPVKQAWRLWLDDRYQVGGFVEVYDRFTFATVRDAGHMVPYYHPQRAYVLFSNFLDHHKLP